MFKIILKSTIALLISSLLFYTIAENCDSIPDINGETSASGRFEIYGGEACETYMKIQWEDYYSNGNEQELRYGTTTSYGTTINLKPFQSRTKITTTVEDLTPDTKYYAQFYRRYGSTQRHVEFTFTTEAGGSLTITTQPQSDSVAVGEQASFTTAATGSAPIAFQWQKVTGDVWADIYNETNTTCTISSVALSDSGNYRVIASNSSSADTSLEARLKIYVPISITYYNGNKYGNGQENMNKAFYIKDNMFHLFWNIEANDQIIFTNLTGRKIVTFDLREGEKVFSLSSISKGLYFIQHLRNGRLINSNKVIINF